MSDKRFPDSAQVVVAGGGIIGASTAYHLAKYGCRDVVLLERAKLTSGSTWHAAGAVGQLRSSPNITRLLGYSVELYEQLEQETGQATGWVKNGSLRLACNADRRAEYERSATMAHSFGLEFEMISPAQAQQMVPPMAIDDLVCAAYVPSDGVATPSDLAMSLAKGAKARGVRIIEGVSVLDVGTHAGRVDSVSTTHGVVRCEKLVICCGIWSRALGRRAGVNIPIQPSHHQYLVTEPIAGLERHCPAVRDPDHLTYFKEEVGGLAIGGYELSPKAFAGATPPDDLEFHLFPEDTRQFEPLMEGALLRFPSLEHTGVKQWFNGLESFTEDGMFILGEAPEVRNIFVGTGFNSFGIASAGGAGRALAEWILDGESPFDLWVADIRRFSRFHGSDQQVRARALEGQGHHYVLGWPHYEHQANRPFRRSPLYDRLKTNGACFGSKSGWERANWFAPDGVEAKDVYSFERTNWFEHVKAEHLNCREKVALFDQSSFAKFGVYGPDAESVLNRICAGDIAHPPGKIIYTQMLNAKGGIECDLTVTRISDEEYFVVSGTGFATHDFNHIQRHTPGDARVKLVDITSAYATLALMGPSARELLQTIAESDLTNEAFPFGTFKEIYVGGAPLRALRVSFVGELGWELHIPTEYAVSVYDLLFDTGVELGLKNAGYRAIESLRLEKGYRLWGSDIGPDYTPDEAGLGFAVARNKNVAFIGCEALESKRQAPLTKRLATFTHDDPEAILLGGETIYRDGERVGWLSSGGHGHYVAKDIGLGYVRHETGVDTDFLLSGRYELEIRTRRVPATVHLKALYDPANTRVKT